MAEETGISWCDSTFNPWVGCTHVGPGCDYCYAEALMDRRMRKAKWGSGETRVRTSAENWGMPLRWDRDHALFAENTGRRRRVFCASLCDVFDNEVDPSWRADLFDLIHATPYLDWLLLTKRIGVVRNLPDAMHPSVWPANVWLGITVVNQAEADRDIPKLLDTPARVRFLSVEPMLGPINLDGHTVSLAPGLSEGTDWLTGVKGQFSDLYGGSDSPWTDREPYVEEIADGNDFGPRIRWVICGGESGPHARPMELDWARSLRDQCAGAGVPFLFKQAGGIGKDKGGCQLDGREHKEWPS